MIESFQQFYEAWLMYEDKVMLISFVVGIFCIFLIALMLAEKGKGSE